MNRHLRFTLVAAIGAAIAGAYFTVAAPAFAQEGQAPATVTIDFKGGTVEDYVELVELSFGGSANIVVENDARLVKIGGVKLTVSNAHNAAAAVEFLEIEGSKLLYTRGGPEFRVIGAEDVQPPDEEFRQTNVWTFAAFLEGGLSAEDALSAIENALELTGGRADVRYHEDTQLLMVNGTQRHLEAVDQVVSRLNGVVNWRENRSRDEAQAKVSDEARGKIRNLEMEREMLMRQIGELELNLLHLQNELDK